MKFSTIALLLGAAEASSSFQTGMANEDIMSQNLKDQFSNLDPRVVVQPERLMPATQGTFLTMESSGNAFHDGYYYNTTRIEKGHQYYKYMWKHACAFTKWTPSNQWLWEAVQKPALKMRYTPSTMDLSRFGLIGTEKKCFWGMIGVLWKKPLGLG